MSVIYVVRRVILHVTVNRLVVVIVTVSVAELKAVVPPFVVVFTLVPAVPVH